jgi:hypothetical protein
MTALYSGYSKSPLFLGQNQITFVTHYYNQREHFSSMLAKNGGIIAVLRYLYWGKM